MTINKWTKRYLEMASLISQWSKDPNTGIGAVVIGDSGQILTTGFNGFARGIRDSKDRLNNREKKYTYIVHGEQNAIYNASLSGISLRNSTLYVYGLPVCSTCADGVIQSGIRKVVIQIADDVSEKWYESFQITKSKFRECEVSYIVYDKNFKRISI